jgi:son of sevenless
VDDLVLSNTNDSSISPDLGKRSDEKIKKLTGSEEALDFYKANLVWYLKPRYVEQLQFDEEGRILSGTRIALVERLVWSSSPKDPISKLASLINWFSGTQVPL